MSNDQGNINLEAYRKLSFAEKKAFRKEWRDEAAIQRLQAKRMPPIQFEEVAAGRKLVLVRANGMRLRDTDGADLEIAFTWSQGPHDQNPMDVLVFSAFAQLAKQLGAQVANYFPDEQVAELRKISPEPIEFASEPPEALPAEIGDISGAMFLVRGKLIDIALFPEYREGVDPFIAVVADVPIDFLLEWGKDLTAYAGSVKQKLIDKGITKVHTK